MAKNNGCPWDGNAIANAAISHHFEAMTWLTENGCPVPNLINAEECVDDGPFTQNMRQQGYRVQFVKIQE